MLLCVCLYLQWIADCKVGKVAKEGTNKEIGYRKYYEYKSNNGVE